MIIRKELVLIGVGLLIEGLYLGYSLIETNPADAVLKYMIVFAAVFAAVTVGFFVFNKRKKEEQLQIDSNDNGNKTKERNLFAIILLFSIVFGVTLVFNAPGQSDDIYRYLWDGKILYHGVSPYRYAPQDAELSNYHSENLPRLVNFPHIKTIYPPFAQMVFKISYTLFNENVTGMKFIFLLFMWGSIVFFYLLLKRNGGDIHWLLFFAWNPLVIMETAVNGHLDIVMVFCLLTGLWFFYRGCLHWAGIAFACAILSKLIPVVLLPVIFFSFFPFEPGRKQKIKERWLNKVAWNKVTWFFVPLTVTVGAFYYPYLDSASNMFLTAMNYSSKWYFNNPVFYGILGTIDHPNPNPIAHMISFLLFTVLFLVILFYPRLKTEQRIFYVMTAFVICNPTIHPWYLVVLLGLLCIYRNSFPVLWSGLIVVSYMVVYRFKAEGIWQDSWWLMAMEYIPLAILVVLGKKRLPKRARQSSKTIS